MLATVVMTTDLSALDAARLPIPPVPGTCPVRPARPVASVADTIHLVHSLDSGDTDPTSGTSHLVSSWTRGRMRTRGHTNLGRRRHR